MHRPACTRLNRPRDAGGGAQLRERGNTARLGPRKQYQEQLRGRVGVVHRVMAGVHADTEIREPVVECGVNQPRFRNQRRGELRQIEPWVG